MSTEAAQIKVTEGLLKFARAMGADSDPAVQIEAATWQLFFEQKLTELRANAAAPAAKESPANAA